MSAVHTAVGRLATVAGKPEKPIFEAALARFGSSKSLFIGDRLDTDIMGAVSAGIPSALVLTGIDRPKHILAAPANAHPDFILRDMRGLFEPYPVAKVEGERVTVDDATVRIDGVDIIIERAGDQLNLLRAGALAIWNSGRAIFGFHVPERLYEDPFRN